MKFYLIFIIILGLFFNYSLAQDRDIWIRISSSIEMEPYSTGYVNYQGDTVIPLNKYIYCYTEKFDKIAFVLHKKPEDQSNYYYAIDRKENILFRIASWDNAPNEIQEGLFRIIVNDKMGFANTDGQIVIAPIYSSVFPFSEGYAAFCLGGESVTNEGRNFMVGGKWGFIDKNGDIKIPAVYDRIYGNFKGGVVNVEQNGQQFRIDKTGKIVN